MRGQVRTYYQSSEYENEAEPGTFAGITICGDDDGPRFVFSSSDQIILDLPIPACEALAMAYAIGRSGKHAIRAAERLREDNPPPAAEPPAQSVRLPRAADRFRETYSPPASWVGAGQTAAA
jgi:hypothetical protein